MARKMGTLRATGRTILLVDDNPEYLEATGRVIEREGHNLLRAKDGPEALEILRTQHVDLCLLDFVMPGMNGEEVVVQLRKFDPLVQVILQTGYASEQPPRELLQRLDIQGYFDKSEGPERLLLWTDVGLKAAAAVQTLSRGRQGLRYILDVTPELHKIQPLEHLLQGILMQISAFIGAGNSFVAVIPENRKDPGAVASGFVAGFVAILDEETGLEIKASTGTFADKRTLTECLGPAGMELVKRAISAIEIQREDGVTVLPLRVGEHLVGVVYLDGIANGEKDTELLLVFANQAAVAIQNSQLYEMATLDPMTGVYVRRFFEQWLLRELRNAFRNHRPISLIIMDLDKFKRINDTAGHLVGDQALIATGEALHEAVRSGDIVGRFGGDEFGILLPQTDADGARRVGDRALEMLTKNKVTTPDGELTLAGSIGCAVLHPHSFDDESLPRPIPPSYFQRNLKALLKCADEAMYVAKNAGGNRVHVAANLQWASFEDEAVKRKED